jgi:hypothetical protein
MKTLMPYKPTLETPTRIFGGDIVVFTECEREADHWRSYYRPAEGEEITISLQKEIELKDSRQRKLWLEDTRELFREKGERPQEYDMRQLGKAEFLVDRYNIFGGGIYFAVDESHEYMWLIENNCKEGMRWSAPHGWQENNVRTFRRKHPSIITANHWADARGWRIPFQPYIYVQLKHFDATSTESKID